MKYLFFLCLCCSMLMARPWPDMKNPETVLGHDFVVSIPQTGTNWVLVSLQHLTYRPVRSLQGDPSVRVGNVNGENRFGLADFSKETLYRTHIPTDLWKIDKSQNNLILLVRDYRERVIRQKKAEFKISYLKNLVKNLQLYEAWDPDHRFMIYYEDMVERPAEVMEEVLRFLGESTENLDNYVAHLEEYRSATLASYHKQHHKLNEKQLGSRGRDIHYYAKRASQRELKAIDEQIKALNFALWEKYLSHYANGR